MTTKLALGVLCSCLLLAQATQEIRIDQFDRKGNRAGYSIYDPRTGRLDQFDSRSRRTGYGTVTNPPSSPTTPSSESSRSVPPERPPR
jgi:hypothetical protein